MFENVLFINIYYIYNKYYIIILLEQQKEITFLRGRQRIVLSVPGQIGPSQISPRSNHCIIMLFFI